MTRIRIGPSLLGRGQALRRSGSVLYEGWRNIGASSRDCHWGAPEKGGAPEKAQGRPAAAERPCWPGVAGQRLLPGGGEAYATPSLRPRKRSCPLRLTSISKAFLSLDLACCTICSSSCGELTAAPSTSRTMSPERRL